jgi:hypothetical protein
MKSQEGKEIELKEEVEKENWNLSRRKDVNSEKEFATRRRQIAKHDT